MSALEAFVNEQKKKAGGNALGGSTSFSSFGDLRSKLTSSLSALPLLSRSETADSESLTGELGADGQLPNTKNRKNGGWFSSGDESFFGMSRTQRVFAFFLSLMGSIFCFSTAAFLIPMIIVSTRKFAALNTLGSVLLLLSFAFLWGPSAYLQHLMSPQRRLVTVCYMSALFATLYSSLWVCLILRSPMNRCQIDDDCSSMYALRCASFCVSDLI
ncbi:Vesicle transport protein [Trichostrongylus colubriformis]|uniref:Vesicle transport protein n=1 Tax=Trichostrongylus colubriformis TaxID=6319 RepID=A0AAN8FGF7_TRICO